MVLIEKNTKVKVKDLSVFELFLFSVQLFEVKPFA